ncbi:MAG: nucleotide pyrophosphohydrolase [Phycisphaerales bacterium]|nr:nucleotide pyrophosphohydrolase [Phycisphaerales bacterium]
MTRALWCGARTVPDDRDTLAALRERVRQFVAEREWQRFHDAKNLSMSLAIEAAELMEHFQWVRSDELPALLDDPARRAEIRDELADVACYLLALANTLELDLSDAIIDKLRKNALKYPAEKFKGWYERPSRQT